MTCQIIPPLTGKPVTGKPSAARPPRPQGLPAANGSRVIPQAVKGKFRTLKWRLLVLCLAVYYVLPFLRWGRGAQNLRRKLPVTLLSLALAASSP